MRTAYIHIGTEKTGSTSIQALLKQNRQALYKRGYQVAGIQCPTNHMDFVAYCIDRYPNNQQKALLNLLNINDPVQHLSWKEQFKPQVDQQLSESNLQKNLIITSEHFHSRIKNPEEIANLKELLSPYYSKLKIIVYLRRQDRLALSLFNEALKYGGTGKNPLYAGHNPGSPFYNYLNLIEMWASVFGKQYISVRLFEKREFFNQSLYDDFLKELEIGDASGLIWPQTANKAPSGYKQYLLLFLNEMANKHAKYHITYAEIRKQIINSKYDNEDIPQVVVSSDERTQFLSRFKESNKVLSHNWLNGKGFDSQGIDEQRENEEHRRTHVIPTQEEVETLLTREILHYLDIKGKQSSASKNDQESYRKNIQAVLELTNSLHETNAKRIKNHQEQFSQIA